MQIAYSWNLMTAHMLYFITLQNTPLPWCLENCSPWRQWSWKSGRTQLYILCFDGFLFLWYHRRKAENVLNVFNRWGDQLSWFARDRGSFKNQDELADLLMMDPWRFVFSRHHKPTAPYENPSAYTQNPEFLYLGTKHKTSNVTQPTRFLKFHQNDRFELLAGTQKEKKKISRTPSRSRTIWPGPKF